MARTDKILFWTAIALSLFGVLSAIDLFFAVSSESCGSHLGGPDCNPWGAEGPAAGSWRYANKTNYLLSGIALAVLPVGALAFIAWTKSVEEPLTPFQRAIILFALTAATALIFI